MSTRGTQTVVLLLGWALLLLCNTAVPVVHSFPITLTTRHRLRVSSTAAPTASGSFRFLYNSFTLSMSVSGIESTPNPSSFLLRLSSPIEGVEGVSALRGKTFSTITSSNGPTCTSLNEILRIDGIESLYVMSETITVSKHPTTKWEVVLPLIIDALGGADDDSVLLMGLLSATSSATTKSNPAATSTAVGQVQVRMQISNKVPIQLEAIGCMGTRKRAKLPQRFADAMSKLLEVKDNDFFASRKWMDRGIRYLPEKQEDTTTSNNDFELEKHDIESVLKAELEEVEAAYPPHRLDAIIATKSSSIPPTTSTATTREFDYKELDLEAVDQLCDIAEQEQKQDGAAGEEALQTLARFVASHEGLLAARRNALAFLGSTGDRTPSSPLSGEQDIVFDAIVSSLDYEKSPAMRRTAGDALSDLGNARAVPYAVKALQNDRSKLVRWRAARIIGELASPEEEIIAVLNQSSLDETAFEVAFELKDALRKVEARLNSTNGNGSKSGPIWKQIQEGTGSQSS